MTGWGFLAEKPPVPAFESRKGGGRAGRAGLLVKGPGFSPKRLKNSRMWEKRVSNSTTKSDASDDAFIFCHCGGTSKGRVKTLARAVQKGAHGSRPRWKFSGGQGRIKNQSNPTSLLRCKERSKP
jgi:hypothetical protein